MNKDDRTFHDLTMPRYRDWMEANVPYQKTKEKAAVETMAISNTTFFMCVILLITAIFYYTFAIKQQTQKQLDIVQVENAATSKVAVYQNGIDQSQQQIELLLK